MAPPWDSAGAPRPTHNTFTSRQNFHLPLQLTLPRQPRPLHRVPRSASLSLELNALARSPGVRPSFQAFALPPSPTRLPHRSLIAAPHFLSDEASLALELDAIARASGGRPIRQAYAIPDSPTPLPRRSSLAAPVRGGEVERRDQSIRYPLASCSPNFTDRRASMPAPESNTNWDSEEPGNHSPRSARDRTAERLRIQLDNRLSRIPNVPDIPEAYRNQILARPVQVGLPPGAVLPPGPNPTGRLPPFQNPTSYYHYGNFDGLLGTPEAGYFIRDDEDPYSVASAGRRRVPPPDGFVVPAGANRRGGPTMDTGVRHTKNQRAYPAGHNPYPFGDPRVAPGDRDRRVASPTDPNPPARDHRAPSAGASARPAVGRSGLYAGLQVSRGGVPRPPTRRRTPPLGARRGTPSAGRHVAPSGSSNEDYTTSATDTNDDDTEDLYSASPVANRRATPPTSFSEGNTTSAVETNDASDSDSEGLYDASPVANRGRGPLGYRSTRNRTPTPTRIPPPARNYSRPGIVVTPIQGTRPSNPRVLTSSEPPKLPPFSGFQNPPTGVLFPPRLPLGSLESPDWGVSPFNESSATLTNTIQHNTGNNAGDYHDRLDHNSIERPQDPVGSRGDLSEKTPKPKKSFGLFGNKASASSPFLRHKRSIMNLKKNMSQSFLGTYQKLEDDVVAPAVREKGKGFFGSDDQPSPRRAPKKSKSSWSIRSKTDRETPTPQPMVIGGPMNVVHVSGTGTALEEVMSRHAALYNDISGPHLDRSATSSQIKNENTPPVARSAPAVRFAEPSRLPRAPTTDNIGARGPTASKVPARGLPKSSTSAKIDGRAQKSSMTKSSTSGEVSRNKWGFATSGRSGKLTSTKSKMSIGSPTGVIHTAGSGTAFESVTSVSYSNTVAGAAPVIGGPAVPNAARAIDIPGLPNNTVLQPQPEPARTPTPATGSSRVPRPASKSKNPFKRSTPSAMSIGSPFNASHEVGDGTAFEEAMGRSTPAPQATQGPANRASPRQYSSMQDMRGRNFSSHARLPSVIDEDSERRNVSRLARDSSPTDEEMQGRNIRAPLNPSKKKKNENVIPSQAHRLLGTISPSRVYEKPSNLPMLKSRTFGGKLSSLSSSFGRSVVNLGARNQSTASLLADSSVSLHAEPTTSVSTATALAEPAVLSARPLSPLLAASSHNVAMVYSPPLNNNWSGMFSTLKDKFLQDLLDSTLRDPSQMQHYQNRAENPQRKKKSKNDEDAGTVGIDNLLTEEESRYKRIFMIMEGRAVGDVVKESLWTFQEQFARIHRMPHLVPASRRHEEESSFLARIGRVIGRKE
ncbi:hypothetical protein VTL71DRAFT_5930 [Oculimacula yallundae]|uniref:Uncharacterized protein n=1 Tax=Oculimacula yallundae TaxID=86028 RepID=A0ABR4C1G4_9HELO